MTITSSGMTPEAIEELINRRVEEAIAAHEGTREADKALKTEKPKPNACAGNMEIDFMKCQPLNFKGTEGVVGLIRWFEKMETVFHINNCPEKSQVKLNYFHTISKLTRCVRPNCSEEETRVKNSFGVIPIISGNVIDCEPMRLQDAVRIANNLMDQKLKGYAMKNAENKRRLEVNQRDNHGQQSLFKRPNVGGQNVARAYTAGNNEKKPYNGLLPLYNKCKLHHEGPCTVRCGKCNKVGHLTRIERTNEVAYKMPHMIEQYNSLSDLEKEHTKSVYLRNEEDKRRGVKLYLMRRSLEVLRKFHCMILRGRFNQLSHVSSPSLSKPEEY
ncbi:hypothetical protein Tco_0891587 [Tanacetum coccineum]|uniref:Reverse transcriptase domain-containing protein n=1 Tax=Tanacetum coccineum TaxID=301880 RepID=A0ABQ5C3P0_9ASTR